MGNYIAPRIDRPLRPPGSRRGPGQTRLHPLKARIHRVPAASPDDVSGIQALISARSLDPHGIVAILGKTEGNGCVNDFTRGYATTVLKAAMANWLATSVDAVEQSVVFVMSGGTEGGLSPHWLVFEAVEHRAAPEPGASKALAFGKAVTRPFAAHEIGRMAQIDATSQAVRAAMREARIDDVADVHYVQVKCPLLTKARIAAAKQAGHSVATEDTLKSMGVSRGASALGVGVALGEVDRTKLTDAAICTDLTLYSGRASTSAGVELLENQVLVVGNSTAWTGDLVITHDVMADAIDTEAVARALGAVGLTASLPPGQGTLDGVLAILAKAEPSQSGIIRGARHTMLDDSDIASSRHARALVGGVLAGVFGTTTLFVSGGAEHQGPDGGGPIAIIARRA